MSSQYDSIGGKYQDAKQQPGARLEEHNLFLALQPLVQGANVLDLACGTGHFSRKLIQWGASSVTAVDISKPMVDFAQNSLNTHEQKRITFQVADCAVPTTYAGGPFDLVVGSWFLNYASDATQLASMFSNISQNLKPGGTFFGICPFPTEDVRGLITSFEGKPKRKYNFDIDFVDEVADGVRVRITLYLDTQSPIQFETYHLRKKVWETSARDGGMLGTIDWRHPDIPEMTDLGDNYWDGFKDRPSFSILILHK